MENAGNAKTQKHILKTNPHMEIWVGGHYANKLDVYKIKTTRYLYC